MKLVEYQVKNLDCAGCAGKIQHRATEFFGVINANLDLYKKRFFLEVDDKYDEILFLTTINSYADEIEPGTKILKLEILDEEERAKARKEELLKEEKREKLEKITILLGAIFFVIALISGRFSENLKLIFAIIGYIILGWDVVYNSIKNLNKGNFMDENFLMTIATLGAFYLNEIDEAVGVMLFYKVGEYFQNKAVSNSRKTIEKLLDIRPEIANIKGKNGEIITLSPKELKLDDIIIVKAGEKIPVDGIVINGESSLNTSALTGESLPQEVKVGDEVLSGSLNGNSVLEIKVTKLFSDSTISKIIEMVENAGNKKAEAEKFITKFAKYYTPIVVILAVVVGAIIPLFIGNFESWIARALIFLVISCPCALVISVPLTFFSSIGIASKNGILIKGGNYLEALTDTDAVVFDKTGTLTKGKFKIDSINPEKNIDENELKTTAKIGEYLSNHPIGKAIVEQINLKIEIDKNNISEYKEISGYGISLKYENNDILVGNYKLMKENQITVEDIEYSGSVVYIAKNNRFLGTIFISDEIKQDSLPTITGLNKLNISTYMLTGDSKKIGEVVGEKIGILKKNIFTQLLPQNKVEILEKIKKEKKKVIFVGDGINDAPVLSLADIGIAMGGAGSDIAVETADIVIMKDEPSKILELLNIAKINKKVLYQNIVLALGIKIVVMILGVLGFANMWLAIFSDVGVSVMAILNASWGIRRYYR